MKRVFLSVVAGTAMGAEVGYELLFSSSGKEIWPEQCVETPGVPAGVAGSFLLAGPAVFEMGGKSFTQTLDGFGKTYRFKVGGGKTCFATRMMQTDFYNRSVAAGTVAHGGLFAETKPPRDGCHLWEPQCNMNVKQDNNYVNSYPVQGVQGGSRVMMVSDTFLVVDYDLDNLQVTADIEWKDSMMPSMTTAPLGSAHPLKDPAGRGGVVGIAMGLHEGPGGDFVDLYHLSPEKPDTRELLASYKTNTFRYFHSFGLTEHYAIFVHDIQFNLLNMAKSFGATIGASIEAGWEGIHVVQHNPAVGETKPMVFQTDPFFHIHTVNSFENATGIVMDLSHTPSDPFKTLTMDNQKKKAMRDAVDKVSIKRMHLHLSGEAKGKVTEEILSAPGTWTEFTRINDAYQGKDYCIFYAVEWGHNGGGYANMAIVKNDICKKTRKYWYRENFYPSEPQFVATGAAEDDGVLVFTALDGARKVSTFVTVDASTMTELSSMELPVVIPFTAHGEWYGASGQTAVVV